MAKGQNFKPQDENGYRLDFHGMNTVAPVDALPQFKYPLAQNVRRYLQGRIASRALEGAPVETLPSGVHSLIRMNDTTPNGPVGGYKLIAGASSKVYAGSSEVATGMSGNKLALIPFRPNTSVQPWAYVGDSNKLVKVRSDGTCWKTGIKEPQAPPVVTTQNNVITGNLTVLGTTTPWNSATNPSYTFTGTGTSPVIISTPVANSNVKITATGSVSIGGGVTPVGPGSSGSNSVNFPGHWITGGGSAPILVGAFTDGAGVIVSVVNPSDLDIVRVGGTATLLVPTNAVQLQLGINDSVFAGNTGSFTVDYTVITSAVATKVSIMGPVTAYYWGDSPHSGPVSSYIWKNTADTYGSGPTRSKDNATGSTTGNSFLFDTTVGSPTTPIAWSQFGPGGTVSGTVSVFEPALESAGYQDFNMCVVGELFIPAAGAYTFTISAFNDVLWGIGGNATWGGGASGGAGQTKTVIGGHPLMPVTRVNGGSGIAASGTTTVTFPAPGIYPIEIDWDYWYHSGRTLTLKCNGVDIVPLPASVKTAVQYRTRYRSSATGAKSNPSPPSEPLSVPVLANQVTPGEYSTDPQVDKVDIFRFDSSVLNYTYVLTAPNTNPPTSLEDALLDTDVSANEILEYDLFEPFPSIDLPKNGVVNVIGTAVSWVSGDKFNTRWLPGTLINIAGVDYPLYNRPTSTTSLTVTGVPSGNNLIYSIAAPTLAGQPTASLWGPTAQGDFMFGTDPNNPGDVVWTNGEDPDSSADTNRWNLTSPSEPMMNGCIANGISLAFSTERSWLFYPTFTSAAATVTGTLGSTWNPVLSGMTRGLFIRTCLAVMGGGLVFFRAKDGICVSAGGGQEESITDGDLYNLFQHEGQVPQPIVIGSYTLDGPPPSVFPGFTIYPPDDTRPEAQSLHVANGYLYYDYQDTNGTPRTLVYDVQAKGWVIDSYQWPVLTHCLEEGQVNGTLVGCSDGTVRPLGTGGTETATAVILTDAKNGGSIRGNKQIGDVFIRAIIGASGPVTVAPYASKYAIPLSGISPNPLTGTGDSDDYILGFNSDPIDANDFEMALSWPAGKGTSVEIWEPSWIDLPEEVKNRPTDWTDCGTPGAKFIQGVRMERNTFGQNKVFSIQSGDDLSLHVPNEACNFAGQSIKSFSVDPFIAHTVKIVTTDGVPWREWGTQFIFQPYPELAKQWTTEMVAYVPGWQSIGLLGVPYIASAPVTITLNFDQWPTITLTDILPATASQLYPTKTKVTIPTNKSKLVSFNLTSSEPFRVFKSMLEVGVGEWGRTGAIATVQPYGGPASDGAEV